MRGKISASHLERRAFVYVRQSTQAQVFQHGESTQRQYALKERAVALGWPAGAVDVVDDDQGCSGATSDRRGGFARIVDAVARGEVGAVLAVEVSRLARSSQDWQRLLSLCAVAETVVVDEQAVYDPADKDDKLLLDIKGTMSEAELNWLGLRLTGALRSKARRGELRIRPPTGYVWTESGLAFDPDESVQRAVRLVFERFAIEASGGGVARWARATGFSFPTRHSYADGTSEVTWGPLGAHRVYAVLKHPVYAGVYTYGRRPQRQALIDGEIRRVREADGGPDKWAVRIDGAHPAYISWETFMANQRKLHDNRLTADGTTRGAAREGRALLVGLVLCGRCGRRMDAAYQSGGTGSGYYRCRGDQNYGGKDCWSVAAGPVDRAIEQLFLDTIVPAELDVSLAVEREVGAQSAAVDRHWKLRIEQAEYEARRAERRYKAVDPDNRVVARTLEREWEERLREVEEVRRKHQEARQQHRVHLTDVDRTRVRALARDLPKVWRAATTAQSDRKAMLRLAIEAISITPVDVPRRSTRVRVAWKGGDVTELDVPRPSYRTAATACDRVRELTAEGLTDSQIAERLNGEDIETGAGRRWNDAAVRWVRCHADARPRSKPAQRAHPLPERDAAGRYSVPAAAAHFGVGRTTVHTWIKRGYVSATLEKYRGYRAVWWLDIDDATESRLRELVKRTKP